MWEIVHWFFLYYLQPSPIFHPFVSLILGTWNLVCHTKPFSKKDVLPTVGLILMYWCSIIEPLHAIPSLSFHPYWIITLFGFRKRYFSIFIGTIVTGFYLFTLPNIKCIAVHVIMNLSYSLTYRKHPIGIKARSVVHFVTSVFSLGYTPTQFLRSQNKLKDFLFVFSSIIVIVTKKYKRPDWLTIIMMFTRPFTCAAWVIHALEIHWYQFLKNNHYRRVKSSFTFVCPVVILVFAICSNTSIMLKQN